MKALIEWQWKGYQQFHQSRKNLLIHIFAVPAFLLANIGLLVSFIRGFYLIAPLMLVVMLFSIAVQGKGHAQEPVASIPFNSAGNAIARLLIEQWINFPRFVLSGAWWRAWQTSAQGNQNS
ncbi:terminase [Undibacterium fentianense]|uniref:Terminase n=1 Tax=Undibacterium fentianense TaxID=2828728 RepID=A0A941DYE6_9BURK|nr:terminase [Undibacterium fentianense]MBR7799045.1 terminase [Undibacterium fentianense]